MSVDKIDLIMYRDDVVVFSLRRMRLCCNLDNPRVTAVMTLRTEGPFVRVITRHPRDVGFRLFDTCEL
jgi:hypothetical protein